MPLTNSWIALGANVGDAAETFEQAIECISNPGTTTVITRSGNYRTPPWGIEDQPDFLNAVIEVETRLCAQDLLDELQLIEAHFGRARDGQRWGPRTLDLDILLYGDLAMSTPRLTIPHPRIHERAFVLVPLAEIAADVWIDNLGHVVDLLHAVDTSRIQRV